MKSIIQTFTLVLASISIATAQDKEAKATQIRIYTESYEVSALEFAKIMSSPTSKNNQTKMRLMLLDKAIKKEAKLVSNHSVICKPGEKATVESVRELIYPTDYEPPSIPPHQTKGDSNQLTIEPPRHTVFPPTPKAFETRNLGHTLEVEATLDENNIIDLRIAPESVKQVGENIVSNWLFSYAKIKVSRPIFYTKRLNTSVTVKDGEFLLANTYSPQKEGKPDHSRKILHFVKAEILVIDR